MREPDNNGVKSLANAVFWSACCACSAACAVTGHDYWAVAFIVVGSLSNCRTHLEN